MQGQCCSRFPTVAEYLNLELCRDPVIQMDVLLIPEIPGTHLEIHRLLSWTDEQQLVWPVHRQPVSEVSIGAKRLRLVISIEILFAATVEQDGLEAAGH